MFTGIVEEMGTVQSLTKRDDMLLWDGSKGIGYELAIKADQVLDGAYLGCSICVSGVCLTATDLSKPGVFTAGLAPETLRRTHLGDLKPDSLVNLERASEIGGRNSGHFVQGHVDGVGTIVSKTFDGDSLTVKVALPPAIMKYIVEKGFVAIDGTSLTVCDVDYKASTFTFMLVEYTQKKIVVPLKAVGDKLNIEVDVLGKYAESALASVTPRLEQLEREVEELRAKLG
jgi:riboflavin synthase